MSILTTIVTPTVTPTATALPTAAPAAASVSVVKPPARAIQLDVLRGVAILLVIGRHPLAEPHSAGRLQPLAELWFHLGWTGVDLFFVLSGFLVGGLLLKELRFARSWTSSGSSSAAA